MKKNDIFEREFDGNILRFQLTDLTPHKVAIRLLDDSLQIDKDIAIYLKGTKEIPRVGDILMLKTSATAFAYDDVFITNLTIEIYNRIIDWRDSLKWVCSNTSLTEDEAEALVVKLHKALRPDYHPQYLLPVVRWTCNGEIDPDSETDIKRMKELLTSYQRHIGIRTKDSMAQVGYKVEYRRTGGFQRINQDGSETLLVTMNELEEAIKPWLNH